MRFWDNVWTGTLVGFLVILSIVMLLAFGYAVGHQVGWQQAIADQERNDTGRWIEMKLDGHQMSGWLK